MSAFGFFGRPKEEIESAGDQQEDDYKEGYEHGRWRAPPRDRPSLEYLLGYECGKRE
jgi:hypothetical protein